MVWFYRCGRPLLQDNVMTANRGDVACSIFWPGPACAIHCDRAQFTWVTQESWQLDVLAGYASG